MQENKSLVQEALIQMKNVEEAIAENAKGILASTMKEEINQLVKESLSEQEDEDEIEIDAAIPSLGDEGDAADNEDMGMNIDMDMNIDSDSPIDLTDATDDEILKVFKAMGEEDGIIVKKDGDSIHLEDENNDVEYLVKLGESDYNHYRGAEKDDASHISKLEKDMEYDSEHTEEFDESVDDVIAAIFDGDTSDVDTSDMEYEMEEQEDDEEEVVYEISLDEEDEDELYEEDELDEEEMEEDLDEEYFTNEAVSSTKPKGVGIGKGPKFSYDNKAKGGFDEDKKEGPKSVGTGKAKFEYKKGANMEGKSKVVKAETKEGQGYDDKEDEKLAMKHGKIASKDLKTTKARRDDAGFEKRETKEAARTYGMGSKEGRGLRKGITNNRNYVYGNNGVTVESLESEVSMLREKNEEYRKALNVFREKLTEVAIFNSNLAYATRLFTEHSTTKKEKINILRRFDDVDTLKESKGLYKSIKEELTKVDSKSINESVGQKINNTVSTGSSTTLIESKTYENPQFMRMKDLMSKLQ
jgi:hypothetical protein